MADLPLVAPASSSRMASGASSSVEATADRRTTEPSAMRAARAFDRVWCSRLMNMVSRWRTKGERSSARSWRPNAAGDAVAALAADDDQRALVGEHTTEATERVAPADVDHQVVALAACVDALAPVVDDVVGADRAHQVQVAGAGHRGDVRAPSAFASWTA